MKQRRIGAIEVGVIGLGTNNFGARLSPHAAGRMLDEALDIGVNLVDTADAYGAGRAEEVIGEHLRRRRARVVIATKFGAVASEAAPGSAANGEVSLAASLRRLKTDYIDIYQLHLPDPRTPIAETIEFLAAAQRAGRVREIGVSNLSGPALREAIEAAAVAGVRLAVIQNRLNLIDRHDDADARPVAAAGGVAYVPYWPLANGLLTGKYRRGSPLPANTRIGSFAEDKRAKILNDSTLSMVELLSSLAATLDRSLIDIAIGWLLDRPGVASVVCGASTIEQLRADVDAGSRPLTRTEQAIIDEFLSRHAVHDEREA